MTSLILAAILLSKERVKREQTQKGGFTMDYSSLVEHPYMSPRLAMGPGSSVATGAV